MTRVYCVTGRKVWCAYRSMQFGRPHPDRDPVDDRKADKVLIMWTNDQGRLAVREEPNGDVVKGAIIGKKIDIYAMLGAIGLEDCYVSVSKEDVGYA